MSSSSRKSKGISLSISTCRIHCVDGHSEFDRSLKNLSISPPKLKNNIKDPVVESWDDQASSSEDEDSTSTTSRPSTPFTQSSETPGPPPPTPSSPTHLRKKSTDWTSFPAAYSANPRSPTSSSFATSNVLDKRPEKSNAAAGRMIAGALGVKAPKKTEEGRAYERAVRDNERKRRKRAKEEEEREEKKREEARKAVWDG